MPERIQKVLANAGVASRRNIEQMIEQGRIAINGKVRVDLPILIDAETDQVTVDGERVRIARSEAGPRIYLLLYKPKGVYCTNVAQGVQMRAIDLLPPNLPGRVYPVGRLDADSKGLVLMTNDGDLAHRLTHPRYGVPKMYRATVEGFVTEASIAELQEGVWLSDPDTGKGFKTSPCRIKIAKRSKQVSILEISIREGRNRQVRRMLLRVGHKVKDLTRMRFGPLTTDGLKVGQVRQLTSQEIRELRSASQKVVERTHSAPGAKSDGAPKAARPSRPTASRAQGPRPDRPDAAGRAGSAKGAAPRRLGGPSSVGGAKSFGGARKFEASGRIGGGKPAGGPNRAGGPQRTSGAESAGGPGRAGGPKRPGGAGRSRHSGPR